MTTGYTCPACGYDDLIEPPYGDGEDASYEICPSCGFEYGYTDDSSGYTFEQWRAEWEAEGRQWFSRSRTKPNGWDPVEQLKNLEG